MADHWGRAGSLVHHPCGLWGQNREQRLCARAKWTCCAGKQVANGQMQASKCLLIAYAFSALLLITLVSEVQLSSDHARTCC